MGARYGGSNLNHVSFVGMWVVAAWLKSSLRTTFSCAGAYNANCANDAMTLMGWLIRDFITCSFWRFVIYGSKCSCFHQPEGHGLGRIGFAMRLVVPTWSPLSWTRDLSRGRDQASIGILLALLFTALWKPSRGSQSSKCQAFRPLGMGASEAPVAPPFKPTASLKLKSGSLDPIISFTVYI